MKTKTITSYVCRIDNVKAQRLKSYLVDHGWEFFPVPHAHWKAGKDKVTVTAYESGKLTVQGKGAGDFVTFILETEILQQVLLGYEDILGESELETFTSHAGVDESGKGDFFGPLVIAAVYVNDDMRSKLLEHGVKDSKEIKSEKKITQLAREIRKIAEKKFAVVTIGPEAYNRLYEKIRNLNRMLAWGHARAIENLLEKIPDCLWVLSDQFASGDLLKNALMEKGRRVEFRQKTKAESDIAVAAASILARDEFLRGLKKISSESGIELLKGAGEQVEKIAAELILRYGKEKLNEVAKIHFRTTAKVLASIHGD